MLLLSACPVEAACCILEHELHCIAVCSHNNSGVQGVEVEWNSQFMCFRSSLFLKVKLEY